MGHGAVLALYVDQHFSRCAGMLLRLVRHSVFFLFFVSLFSGSLSSSFCALGENRVRPFTRDVAWRGGCTRRRGFVAVPNVRHVFASPTGVFPVAWRSGRIAA